VLVAEPSRSMSPFEMDVFWFVHAELTRLLICRDIQNRFNWSI